MPGESKKLYDPDEPVAITLTVREWETVRHWLEYGGDYHAAKKWECLGNIHDQALAHKMAADHEKEGAKAERLAKIIEDTLCPPQQPQTE